MLEDLKCLRRPDLRLLRDSLFLVIALSGFVLCPKLKTALTNGGLCITAATVFDLASLFLCKRIVFFIASVSLTNVLLLTETPYELEALLAVANGKSKS